MAEKQVNKIRWEDGRHAEKHVVDWHVADDGAEQREVELFVEPERQLNLKQRVIEKRKPVVYHRTTQIIDGDKIVEQQVEERDEDKLELVQHIGVANPQQNLRKDDDLANQVRELVNVLKQQPQEPQQMSVRRMSRSELADVQPQPPLQGALANPNPNATALIVINAGLSLVILGLLTAIGYYLIFV